MTDDNTYPRGLKKRDQWVLWESTSDGRKVPRAPWNSEGTLRHIDVMDPEYRVSFAEAREWQSRLSGDLGLAYILTWEDDFVLVDLDNAVVSGILRMEAEKLLEQADSYASFSPSRRGIHLFLRGDLSDRVGRLSGYLVDQSVQVYDRCRLVPMTGDRLNDTPDHVERNEALINNFHEKLDTVSSDIPDRAAVKPDTKPADLEGVDTTSNIQDIFDAIAHIRPSDITIRSTPIPKHGIEDQTYDPSWVYRDKNRRFKFRDGAWVDLKYGSIFDTLQLVALEKRIINDTRDYPEGEDFWTAVRSLRNRGASIPHYDPPTEPLSKSATQATHEKIDKWEIAKRINYGEAVRTHVHPRERDHQEKLALKLAPGLFDAAKSLKLGPEVTYRAANLYLKGQRYGVVPGDAPEITLGTGLRIGSIEAGVPRPLSDIGDAVGKSPQAIRDNYREMLEETDLLETLNPSDVVVEPADYIPHMSCILDVTEDEDLQEIVKDLLDRADLNSAANPLSEAAAAFYVAVKDSDEYSLTQADIADSAGLTKVTIRNHFQKFGKLLRDTE